MKRKHGQAKGPSQSTKGLSGDHPKGTERSSPSGGHRSRSFSLALALALFDCKDSLVSHSLLLSLSLALLLSLSLALGLTLLIVLLLETLRSFPFLALPLRTSIPSCDQKGLRWLRSGLRALRWLLSSLFPVSRWFEGSSRRTSVLLADIVRRSSADLELSLTGVILWLGENFSSGQQPKGF